MSGIESEGEVHGGDKKGKEQDHGEYWSYIEDPGSCVARPRHEFEGLW